MPLLLVLSGALLGCGGAGADGGELAAGRSVKVTIESAEPYTETLPAAENLPARFEVEGQRAEMGKCNPVLVDPERDVRLRVAVSRTRSRSTQRGDTTFVVHSGYGDYDVDPLSAYGLGPDERLRVDCSQDVPVGRVAREE